MARFVKYVTAAGLVGLAVLHADAIGGIVTAASNTFRKAGSL